MLVYAVINLCAKVEVSISVGHEDMQKVKKLDRLGVAKVNQCH